MSKKLLQEILAKNADELSEAEAEFLNENSEELTDEEKEKFDEVLEDDEEELDEKALGDLIQKSVQDLVDQKTKSITNMIAKKFAEGVSAQRKEFLAGADNGKNLEADKVVGRFFKALSSKDVQALKAISEEQRKLHAKYLNSETDAEGGYLLPVELTTEIWRIANEDYGVARQEFFNMPFNSKGNTRKIPNLASGVIAFWTAGGAKKKSSIPNFGVVEQALEKIAVIIPWTDEFAEDEALNITSLIARLVAEYMTQMEDEAFFIGDGTNTYGGFTGILNNGSVAKATLASGTTFSDVTLDDLEQMPYKINSSIAKTGKYYMHRTILGVIRRIKDDNGNYIYQKPDAQAPNGYLWNKPIVLVDAMPSTDTLSQTNKPFVLFTDLRKISIFSQKGTLAVKQLTEATITDSDGLTALNLAEQDMSALRFVERVTASHVLPTGAVALWTAPSS